MRTVHYELNHAVQHVHSCLQRVTHSLMQSMHMYSGEVSRNSRYVADVVFEVVVVVLV